MMMMLMIVDDVDDVDDDDDVDDGVRGHGDPGHWPETMTPRNSPKIGTGGLHCWKMGSLHCRCTVKSSNVESAKGCCTEAQPDKILSDIALLRWSSTQ